MYAILKEAMRVQRQLGFTNGLHPTRGNNLYRIVIGNDGSHPAVRDPLQQLLVLTIKAGAGVVQLLRVWVAVHLQDHFSEAGVQAKHVTRLHHDVVLLHDPHQGVIANFGARPSIVGV